MTTKRKVRRTASVGRPAAILEARSTNPLLLPTWARQFVAERLGWADLILTITLTPVAVLGLVLSLNSLPLEFLGHPANNTGIGLSVVVLLGQFILMALAIRPLFARAERGWWLFTLAMLAHTGYDVLQQQVVRGAIILAIALYFLLQVRAYFLARPSA